MGNGFSRGWLLQALAHYPTGHPYGPTMFSSPAILLGSILFGAIGLGAFIYGKRMVLYKPMVIGIVLMAYPYFVSQTWLMYTIGCALCLGLYVFRD